ncbi:hypothetical protein [Streptomyces sp. 6-11-2]|uniref:hypothetical protein n=1 Tax=Streptomyces sp. 6-11-2 TaxID=2585753 RepID=UPI001142F452|nr:hypothetical protein [Streptomyces sp. 6-11-2]GED89903.1 hypothetical protein TNCT6_69880 [Streptomyces sp. 6-11-2]
MRARDALRTAVGTTAAAGLGVVLLWASDKTPGWLAPALTAVITGVAVEKLAEVLGRRRAPATDGPGSGTGTGSGTRDPLSAGPPEPLACHVKLTDTSFFHVPALGDEPDRTVPASGFILRLTVTALAGRTVVLSALRPVVLERHRPRGYLMPHAGVVSPRRYTVLLDPDPPRLKPRGDDRRPFSYKVSPDDPEVFELLVVAEHSYVVWTLELDWICEDRQGTTLIDLAGHPFRTMARPPRSTEWSVS